MSRGLIVLSILVFASTWFRRSHYVSSRPYKQFCVITNFTVAEQMYDQEGNPAVGLALHTSLQFLHNIFEQVTTFDGAISLSVFLEHDIEKHINYIGYILKCDEDIMKQISIHIVWKKSVFDETCPDISLKSEHSCFAYNRTNVKRFLETALSASLVYPINTMRNIARRFSISPISLVSDIEMIPSHQMSAMVSPLANNLFLKQKKKIALIVRRFEISDTTPMPQNVFQLYDQFKNQSAIEFHSLFYREGHYIENLNEWFNESMIKEKITAKKIFYKNSNWEPQVILQKDDPYHNEFMPTRHRDHQALIYELCRAGYRFFVLSHVFNVHRGIKTTVSLLERKVLIAGLDSVQRRSTEFHQQMNLMYPTTLETCARWDHKPIRHRRMELS